MEFSIVVPVCNEAGNVRPLLAEIDRAMHGQPGWEVVYVDDGSDDGTAAQLTDAQAVYPQLRVLRHARRRGQSTALLTGIEAARATWIVTLDGDGQNDPADIPALIERLRAEGRRTRGEVMLAGCRGRRRDSLLRRVSSRVANAVRGCLLGDGTPDTGCGIKLFRRDLYLQLPAFDHMHRFLPALMQRQGVAVISVPVGHRPRSSGRSKYGINNRLWVGLVDLAGVMWLLRRPTGGEPAGNGMFSRLGDHLGVAWLQRRPCRAGAREESSHV